MPNLRADGVPRPTLARVAAETDVSVSTVSKVLNGRAGVSSATRERVEKALREHGYSRRNQVQPSARFIELVFSRIDNSWALEMIIGAEKVARESGMSVLLTESGDRHSPGPEWVSGVLARQPAGVILMFSDLSREDRRMLRTRDIPFVVIDPAGDPPPDVASVGTANWSGGFMATRHLIELGHTEIAIITGPDDMLCSTARLSGYRAAMDAAGLSVPAGFVVSGDFHHEDGLERGGELLDRARRPTAIFAGSDLQALGVYEAARERGVGIPDELSVVGFDDIRPAAWAGPPLTTVRAQLTEMAETAARLVLRMRREATPERIELATRMVVRSSTAAPPAGG
ncbi:LacI family DNA-binding transcriptional regulator [Isoptericola halotolerans]|uniref:LacI family xylobiose transport system transcriptional regulator n=1 Tax=Isoptericola halotolerans TaxID=300560 RepID=A0ABX2A7T2_9MICO|nr:LacI family DNA-binding transcriptional regulator [Isoptericola halotolerans]NOV97832.1 LacI family xylobiose transport system transcriptional regulator [Isoptericola halotolerans]